MAFHPLCAEGELSEGEIKSVNMGKHKLIICRSKGHVFIMNDRCPHMDAPLSTGKMTENAIVCRAHGIAFSLETGQAEGALKDMMCPIVFYPVVHQNGQIGVSSESLAA